MANRTWSESKTKVSVFIEDTDTTFLGYIGDWLNDKYQDVWRRMSWSSAVNNTYSFNTVAKGSATACTGEADDDNFTATAHGLYNGDVITLAATTMPTGLSAGNYFVINSATNTFQVSTAKDGAAETFTTDGTTVTFTFVARDSYNLPLDFDRELFVANIADGQKLDRYTEALWWAERGTAYLADTITSGEFPSRYIILKEAVNTAHTGFGKIFLDPAPSSSSAKTFAMPYKRKWRKLINISETATTDTANKVIASAGTFITDGVEVGMVIKNTTDNTYGTVVSVNSNTQLTADWDICPDGNEAVTIQNLVIIPDIDYILEFGALAEAFAYKKFFQKADYYNMKYEGALDRRIGQEKAQPNQRYQFIPDNGYSGEVGRPLTGWSSYDSL